MKTEKGRIELANYDYTRHRFENEIREGWAVMTYDGEYLSLICADECMTTDYTTKSDMKQAILFETLDCAFAVANDLAKKTGGKFTIDYLDGKEIRR